MSDPNEAMVLQAVASALTEQEGENLRLSRQARIVPESVSELSVFILGAGGIGSNAAITLAKMGVQRFEVWDNDDVGEENVYPGGFTMSSVGVPKVSALSNWIYGALWSNEGGTYSDVIPGVEFVDVRQRFNEHSEPRSTMYDVVIASPDTMEARRTLWRRFEELGIRWRLWIDARMGGSTASVFSIMYNDDNAIMTYNGTELEGPSVPLPCGEKATAMITVGFIPGMIAQSVRALLKMQKPVYWQQYDGDAQTLYRYDC